MGGITNIKLNHSSKNPSIVSMYSRDPFPINLSRELAMTRFVPPYFASSGAATSRTGSAVVQRSALSDFDSAKPLAGMLLAAVVAALMVVADQLIETWADGHLLVVWVGLWTVTFAALALLAPPLRQLSNSVAVALARWSRARAEQRAQDAMWQLAQRDSRIMGDIQMAVLRSERQD
jgi:hypothetical protein